MGLNAIQKIDRESLALSWATIGLYLFLSAFFWASGPAPLRTVFYLFLLLPFLLVLPWRKFQLQEYGGYYTLVALIYAAYTVLASLWGNPADVGFFLKQYFFLAFWLCGVAWLFYHRQIKVQRLFMVIIGIGLVCAVVTIYFFYIYKSYGLAARLSGFGLAQNSTIVAQIFGVASLLAYVLSLRINQWKLSVLLFIVAMICSLPIIMSQSRGAALSLMVTGFAALLIVRPHPSIWVPQMILIVVALSLFFGFTDMDAVLEKRGLSFSFRDAIWKELIVYRIPSHFFFGVGMEANARLIIPDVDVFHHAHNSWIDILYYAGAVGLVLALGHLVLLLRSFSLAPDILPLYLWLVYGCLCLFTNGSTLLTRPDAQWWMYWVPAGLLVAVIMSRRHAR